MRLAMGLFASLCLWIPLTLAADSPRVHEFQLDNGLKILVQEDHRAPVVVSQLWYKVGSSHEPPGLTGISHVLEHMMFKGTENLKTGEFSRIIAAEGGRENAFTGRDYTAYFQQLEKERLEVSFRLEAERMHKLRLDAEEVAKEIRVVMEERRLRTDDSPQGLTQEQLYATAFVTSPYRNPVIGWERDLQTLDLEDLSRWYRQWYAPNNATLVVVGDVQPQTVFALAETHFGPLPPSEPPIDNAPADDAPQLGERRVMVKAPAELPYLIMGYKVPTLKDADPDWEPYALEVLAGILDGGGSARFSRELVRGSQLAASAGVGYSLSSRLDSLLVLAATPAPGREVAALEQALREQVRQLQEQPVEAAELRRVIAQVVAADVYQRDSTFYQAMRLGIPETIGLGWEALADYVERVQQVTPEQIQKVARKYLTDERLTVAILEPQSLVSKAPSSNPAAADALH